MSSIYIVTDSLTDVQLLKKLLPSKVQDKLSFLSSSGRSQAVSMLRSILAVKNKPTILLLDADTEEKSSIDEHKGLIKDLVELVNVGTPYEILFAVPEIEEILFYDKEVAEHLFERTFSEIEWAFAQSKPKVFLAKLLEESSKYSSLEDILNSLDRSEVRKLSMHDIIKSIISFVNSIT